MAIMRYIVNLKNSNGSHSIGKKADNLQKLWRAHHRIPTTYVCTWEAYHRYLRNDVSLVNELCDELSAWIKPDQKYAVRSSANIEDNPECSFAGQFKTVLNAQGMDSILLAIWSIWATTASISVQTYVEKKTHSTTRLSMAVIIQEMAEAVVSGVSFSKNPLTGANETVVECVSGSGDALVQSGLTPSRWIKSGTTWKEISKDGSTPKALIEKVVRETRKIARTFQTDLDLEWAWDGHEIYWLQAREITGQKELHIYSNSISKEMLPGMIKPLIWSVNIPMVGEVFIRFLEEMLGTTGLSPEKLIKSFYYRVYFNMGALGQAFQKMGLPSLSLEMMMGVTKNNTKMMVKPTLALLRRLPRVLFFVFDKWLFHHKLRRTLPDLEQRVRDITWQNAGQMKTDQLRSAIDQLYSIVQEITYFNILCPMLSSTHNKMLERELRRLGVEPANFNLFENLPELTNYDPGAHINELQDHFLSLDPQLQKQICQCNYAEFLNLPGIDHFHAAVQDFIERFGYLSDNGNDFSYKPWREDPDMILRMILDIHTVPEGTKKKINFADLQIHPLRYGLFKLYYDRARLYRLMRERVSALYTHAYGLFRYYYFGLGELLVRDGIIQDRSDIFYLTQTQILQIINGESEKTDWRAEILQHKARMEEYRDISLPTTIYGDETPSLENDAQVSLSGLATSIGFFSGPVKVAHGIKDIDKVEQGDVLVIPYSDVGWSPLFAKVGAVIAESGGMLSHSSIIAREYGIPAVVAVHGAMRLPDHTRVTVNGYTGEILIHSAS